VKAVANYIYRQPPEKPMPPPRALLIGLDWKSFHTPPYAGGLADQPIRLMKDIRLALHTYNSIQSWREAQNNLNAKAFEKFCSSRPELVRFMQDIWFLQEADETNDEEK
jgi:hypothetical protein